MKNEVRLDGLKNHSLDRWSKELIEMPPALDSWQEEQVGSNNDGPYRAGYKNIAIKDNGEPLVSCSNYGLVSRDHYLNELIGGNSAYMIALERGLLDPFAWVRQSVAERLVRADSLLREHDLFLIVNSGWRHPLVQKIATKQYSYARGVSEAARIFAPVYEDYEKSPTPHSTGGACDIELWSLQNQRLLSVYDGTMSYYGYERNNDLSKDAELIRGVRRILFHLLTTPNVCLDKDETFTIHPGEYWHFGDGDPMSAYLSRQPFAKFGFITPVKV